MSELEFAVFIVAAFFLLNVKVVGPYLSIVNTLFHEFGHALAAILTFGKIDRIELFSNTEGTAWTSNPYWIGRVITSFSGYPFASAISFLFMYYLNVGNYLHILIIIALVVIFSLIFWIRNLYGFLWSISSIVALYFLVMYGSDFWIEKILFLIVSLMFVESIKSSWTILKLSFKQPLDAGDATNMWKSIVLIPPQVWGVLFFLQSVLFTHLTIQVLFF